MSDDNQNTHDSKNRFAEAVDVRQLIQMVVGAASSPWMRASVLDDSGAEPLPATRDTLGRDCIFQSEEAIAVADEAYRRLAEMQGWSPDPGAPVSYIYGMTIRQSIDAETGERMYSEEFVAYLEEDDFLPPLDTGLAMIEMLRLSFLQQHRMRNRGVEQGDPEADNLL